MRLQPIGNLAQTVTTEAAPKYPADNSGFILVDDKSAIRADVIPIAFALDQLRGAILKAFPQASPAGFAFLYYQWETALRFTDIIRYVPVKSIISLYSSYHEMDIRQFCDKMNELYRAAKPETNLKLADMISCMEVKEDDPDFMNAIHCMFKGLEKRKPDCAVII